MPMAPPRACKCGRLQPCPTHTVKAWTSSDAPLPTRIRGRAGQRMRQRLLRAHPLCVLCLKKGITRATVIRDHVIPLAEDGRDDETNEQALCQDCSDTKTQEEAKRGVRRHYGKD
jgi:5-methylcytosine-specific restriction protein A